MVITSTIKEMDKSFDQVIAEEILVPAELESWRIEELEDLLPANVISDMDEFDVAMLYYDSIDQIYGISD